MKKFAKIAMAASVFMMPFAANAAPADGTYSGPVKVHKGLTLNCTLTVDVLNNGTQVGNLSLTGLLCGLVSFNNAPYTVVSAGPNTYQIQDVNVTTITPGDCDGNIEAVYDDSGAAPTIILNGTLPASDGGGDCSIEGDLELE